jgi:hypothetical protein
VPLVNNEYSVLILRYAESSYAGVLVPYIEELRLRGQGANVLFYRRMHHIQDLDNISQLHQIVLQYLHEFLIDKDAMAEWFRGRTRSATGPLPPLQVQLNHCTWMSKTTLIPMLSKLVKRSIDGRMVPHNFVELG